MSVLLTASGESAELVELFRRSVQTMPHGPDLQQHEQHLLAIGGKPATGSGWTGIRQRNQDLYQHRCCFALCLHRRCWNGPGRKTPSARSMSIADSLDRIFALRDVLEEFCRGAANIEIIGRGAAYGGAVMSALTIREMSGFRAAAHTGAGFKHGPNLDVDGTHVAIIFALGRAASLGFKLSDECIRRGGKVVLVSAEDRPPAERLLPVRVDAVPEPWEGISALLVPQALTLAMVERSGCRLPPRFQYGAMEQ